MPRPRIQREVLSIGQFAKLWGIGREHAAALIEAGQIPAFEIPSVGKYGTAVRILLAEVLQKQEEWRVAVSRGESPMPVRPRGPNGTHAKLRHLPELNDLRKESNASGQTAKRKNRRPAKSKLTPVSRPDVECRAAAHG